MERSVSTIRDHFYRDLILEYIEWAERSFLYRYFWADSVSGLLEEYLPGFPMEGPLSQRTDVRSENNWSGF